MTDISEIYGVFLRHLLIAQEPTVIGYRGRRRVGVTEVELTRLVKRIGEQFREKPAEALGQLRKVEYEVGREFSTSVDSLFADQLLLEPFSGLLKQVASVERDLASEYRKLRDIDVMVTLFDSEIHPRHFLFLMRQAAEVTPQLKITVLGLQSAAGHFTSNLVPDLFGAVGPKRFFLDVKPQGRAFAGAHRSSGPKKKSTCSCRKPQVAVENWSRLRPRRSRDQKPAPGAGLPVHEEVREGAARHARRPR